MLSSEFNCRNHSSKLSAELVHAVNCHKTIDIIVNIKKNDISIMELELEKSRNTLLAAHSKRTVCNHVISQMMTEQQPSAQHAFITSQLMLLCPSHPTVFYDTKTYVECARTISTPIYQHLKCCQCMVFHFCRSSLSLSLSMNDALVFIHNRNWIIGWYKSITET